MATASVSRPHAPWFRVKNLLFANAQQMHYLTIR